jgi:hypothetical protein
VTELRGQAVLLSFIQIIFQVDLLKILDEPIQSNGNLFDSNHHNGQKQTSLNPLEDLLFGTDIPTNHSHNSN